MRNLPKREASYSKTWMVPRNSSGPPLTQAGGKHIEVNSREPKKPEPATDDEPEASTDEHENDDDISDEDLRDYRGDNRGMRASGTSVQEKNEADENPKQEQGRRRVSQRKKGYSNGQTAGQKRVNEFDENNNEGVFAIYSQSQESKRHKSRKYGSRTTFKSTPSSTPASADPMSIPNSQQDVKAVDQPTEDKEEVGFKFPMEIDLGSPAPRTKTRRKIKSKRDVKSNGASTTATFSNDAIASLSHVASPSKNHWLFQSDDSSLSSPLSSAASSFILELSQLHDPLDPAGDSVEEAQQNRALCPICSEEVDPELLEAFRCQPRQRIRDQLRFCESHQQTTAEKHWRERGYPSIDWDKFEERIQGYFADLDQLLVPDNPSYYHNVLVSALKSGNTRSFRLTLAGDGLERISCGYYGTRGATTMYGSLMLHSILVSMLTRPRLQALTIRFSHKIRRLAASDQVVHKAGVVGYTQSVLVPELAMRLVKEDMNVGDDTARQIMRESIEIGEIFNSVPDDVVPVPEEEPVAVD